MSPDRTRSQDNSQVQRLAVLGSTGSVGRQALDVARAHPDRLRVVALAARSDAKGINEQAREFRVRDVALAEVPSGFSWPAEVVARFGPEAVVDLAVRDGVDIVLNALVGAAGLRASLAVLQAGKVLALANKESLVVGGPLVMREAGNLLRPVDSEHCSLWQLLLGVQRDDVRRMFLLASGGPFLGYSPTQLAEVDVRQALAHPVWSMGPKISVDSATLMNKGLEVIEAHFLFGFSYDDIEVIVHPQGIFHGLVEMKDNSVFAHAATPDMKLPIQTALLWPERRESDVAALDWKSLSELSFASPDASTFRCLPLAYEAGRLGETFPAVLNAANEEAVTAFLEGRLPFLGICEVIESILGEHEPLPMTLDGVEHADEWARGRTNDWIERLRDDE